MKIDKDRLFDLFKSEGYQFYKPYPEGGNMDVDVAEIEARVVAYFSYRLGDVWQNPEGDIWTAAIDIADHGSAIEIHRSTKAEAIAMRKRIFEDLLK